jgi:hypothetical protein
MTEVKSNCDHPDEYMDLYFDILDRPYYSCKKCGSDISVNDKKSREQQSLWE